jgi:hypothetical protein
LVKLLIIMPLMETLIISRARRSTRKEELFTDNQNGWSGERLWDIQETGELMGLVSMEFKENC